MEQFITKVEMKENSIEFTYYNSKMKKIVADIPISELTAEYYGSGRGISSLVSNHMRIERKGQTLIKQYIANGWTLDSLKETTEKLSEIKKLKTNANTVLKK